MPLCIPISSVWGFPMLNNLTNPWWCLPVCFSHSGVSADVPHCGSLLYPDDEWCWPLWGHLALPFDEIPIQISRSYFFFSGLFKDWFIGFLLYIDLYELFIYILNLSQIPILQMVFSYSVVCLFIIVMVHFNEKRVLILMIYHFSLYSSYLCPGSSKEPHEDSHIRPPLETRMK